MILDLKSLYWIQSVALSTLVCGKERQFARFIHILGVFFFNREQLCLWQFLTFSVALQIVQNTLVNY